MQVLFDPLQPVDGTMAAQPALLFSTNGGTLARAQVGSDTLDKGYTSSVGGTSPSATAVPLYQEASCALASCEVDKAVGQDIMCITDNEGLVFLRRHLS